MRKQFLSRVMLFITFCFLTSCDKKSKPNDLPELKSENVQGSETVKKDKINYDTSPIRPNQKLEVGTQMTDRFEFINYNDDGDYFLIFVKKNNEAFSLIYDWDVNEKYKFNRGDIINIDWKMDSMRVSGDGESLHFAEWAKAATKVKNGNVSLFKKKHKKPLKFNYQKEYSDSYLDKIYLLVEYYLANSKQELVKANLNDSNIEIEYSIEERTLDGKEYIVIGIGNNFENHTSIMQWLYIENGEETELYEYDLANEKLIKFD
jgi:hypothetical protein